MKVMALAQVGRPLEYIERAVPEPGSQQVLVKVSACGVCRTDLHVVDGELPDIRLPIVPGHEVVGTIERMGNEVTGFRVGQRVGVPWLGHTCGNCWYCAHDRENLCDAPDFTGYTIDGGYADYVLADARYCFAIPSEYGDVEAAPLLCAGLIGYRSLRAAGPSENLGIYGFGAAAHIVVQIAKFEGRKVYAFTRPGDKDAQDFAKEMGAVWAGASDTAAPEPLDSAIIFAPVG
ncbi:MAG: alcohol dehydrogenase catalytic domain-containing protein, partial [Hyphomicrobiales bacterium]|nr:alcohol dehydrogenase catalytic domain-containing protein [Hyphomicrobiales bacterium]